MPTSRSKTEPLETVAFCQPRCRTPASLSASSAPYQLPGHDGPTEPRVGIFRCLTTRSPGSKVGNLCVGVHAGAYRGRSTCNSSSSVRRAIICNFCAGTTGISDDYKPTTAPFAAPPTQPPAVYLLGHFLCIAAYPSADSQHASVRPLVWLSRVARGGGLVGDWIGSYNRGDTRRVNRSSRHSQRDKNSRFRLHRRVPHHPPTKAVRTLKRLFSAAAYQPGYEGNACVQFQYFEYSEDFDSDLVGGFDEVGMDVQLTPVHRCFCFAPPQIGNSKQVDGGHSFARTDNGVSCSLPRCKSIGPNRPERIPSSQGQNALYTFARRLLIQVWKRWLSPRNCRRRTAIDCGSGRCSWQACKCIRSNQDL